MTSPFPAVSPPDSGPQGARELPAEVDAVVVGAGPAGLSAALWLARHRRGVLVVDSGTQRAAVVDAEHGYLGRDPLRPRDLYAAGRRELLAHPTARIVDDEVVALSVVEERPAGVGVDEPDGFVVWLRAGVSVHTRRVVLACGVRDRLPDVAGLADQYGAGALPAPGDGYLARDRDVVVLGADEDLAAFAADLAGWARSVTLVHPRACAQDPKDARHARLRQAGVATRAGQATRVLGERGAVRGVELACGCVLDASLVYLRPGQTARSRLARQLGCALDGDGLVVTDRAGRTSVHGVYAAGDLTPGPQLTAVAAAEGVTAGVACAASLTAVPRAARPT